MSKRRLPPELRGGEPHEASSHSSLRQPQQSGRSSSRKRMSDIFSKLADACNKHSTYHQNHKKNASREEDEDNLPEKCRKDLQSMRALLPKVEKYFEHSDQSEAEDVWHLCDFYKQVLRGSYCPHSPALFGWGKQPKDVLSRVYLLFQHSICRSVVANPQNSPLTSSEQQRSILQTISYTIAHLLSFLTRDDIFYCISSDLTNLASDCSIILEGHLLPAQLTIFDETLEHAGFEGVAHYTLKLQTIEEVWVLQTATCMILPTFLEGVRSKRIEASTETLTPSIDNLSSLLPSGVIDIVFSPTLMDKENMVLILSVLRHMCLSNISSSKSPTHTLFALRRWTALKVMKQILNDWRHFRPLSTTLTEASILIARATKEYYDSISKRFGESSVEHEILFVSLLNQALIQPPQVQGSISYNDILWMVRAPTLQTLLECLEFIAVRSSQTRSSLLDVAVLRILHAVIFTTNESNGKCLLTKAATYSLSHGIFHYLFSCLAKPDLSSLVLGIVGALLNSVDFQSDGIESVCRSCLAWSAVDPMDTTGDLTNAAKTVPKPSSAGSKRKRTPNSPQRREPIPLHPLEISSPTRRHSNTSENSKLFFWKEEVGQFLQQALCAGKRLVTSILQIKNQEGSINDCVLIMGGIRLLLHQLRQQCDQNMDQLKYFGSLDLLGRFLKDLRACCDELSKREIKELTPFQLAVSQAIISCGVYTHFIFKSYMTKLNANHTISIRTTLDTFAYLGMRLVLSDFPQEPGGTLTFNFSSSGSGDISCPLRCLGISISKEIHCEASLPTGVDSLLSDARRPNSLRDNDLSTNYQDAFAFDCSIVLFDLLSLRSRSFLLLSLHTPIKDSHIDSSKPASSLDASLLDSLFAFSNGEPSFMSSKLEHLSSHCALFFAPVLLLSQTRAEIESGETTSVEFWPRFSVLSTKFLENALRPIVKTLDATNDDVIELLLLTFNRLKAICNKREDRRHFADSSTVVGFFFDRIQIEVNKESTRSLTRSNDELRLLREMMFYVAEKVQESHSSPRIRRLRWECIASACVDCPSDTLREVAMANQKGVSASGFSIGSQSWLFWLLSVPFCDPDTLLRTELSDQLAKVIMADNYSFLFSLFASSDEIKTFDAYRNSTKIEKMAFVNTNDLVNASDQVVTSLFRGIDSLLADVCSIGDSQLSFTMTRSEQVGTLRKDKPRGDIFLFQRSATKILASLCRNANLEDPVGVWFFEKAITRLIRMWAVSPIEKMVDPQFPELPSTPPGRAMAFGELACLTTSRPLPLLISQKLSETFAAAVFCDILVLSASNCRETQYFRLESFIRSFVCSSQKGESKRRLAKEALTFIEDQLPAIVCQFVVEKDSELLQLTAGFREFLDESCKSARRKDQVESPLVGGSNAPSGRKIVALHLNKQELERKLRHLCLQPKMIERILPLILINSDRAGLVFFLSKVLSVLSLKDIIQNREQLILKELVWELGNGDVRPSLQAIRVAATALLSATTSSGVPAHQGGEMGRSNSLDPSLATRWVSSHFMYLLVNVIQYRWKSRTRKEQLHALRCLHGLLTFLLPSESAQYFPQIMATINAANTNSGDSSENDSSEFSEKICLQLLAIKCLSKFVRLVADHQIDTIAMNLTTIVVSLIPVLNDANQEESTSVGHWALRESEEEAVSLLEFLTNGQIGKALAKDFNHIPFLPQLPSLRSVHEALRSNNVDFDNLILLSSGTQRGGGTSRRESLTSEGSHSKASISSRSFEKLAGLQQRLYTLTSLLDNENFSVRNVVLQHLTDLLRANRDLFHNLIEDEGTISIKHCLTLMYPEVPSEKQQGNNKSWLPQGAVTEMVEKILSRCVQESNPQTRVLIAACLGEIGGIGEHKLGDLNVGTSADSESLDSPNSTYKWRLGQPPWQSRAAKYELQLVTRHLVVALKAAPSSSDQHKVAFTIQQLLVLLDRSDRQTETDKIVEGSRNTREMSGWLKGKLIDSGVYEVVEPFWFSEFHEKSEGFVAKEPPFSIISPSYYLWISNFCRWMISHSHKSALSPWKDFFYACRTVIRTQAGISMSEFILPLLILDRICFGTHKEEAAIRQEFLNILTADPSLASTLSMSHGDHQRAVSSVFMVIETLNYWVERETEDRYKSSRSTGSSNNRRKQSSSKVKEDVTDASSWPADKTISRIEDLVSTIPLSAQARAAANTGMHARSLRLLEMAGRKRVVEEVYESSLDQQKTNKNVAQYGTSFQSSRALVGNYDGLNLMKDALARLDDCETMASIGEDFLIGNPLQQVRDSIRRKEASGDFEGALQDYERALQLQNVENRDSSLQSGILTCLLELGQFESVLNQVRGLIRIGRSGNEDQNSVTSFAVEAAWRLGRWETLSDMVEKDSSSSGIDTGFQTMHQISVGKAMLGLHRKDRDMVTSALERSREALMHGLSSAARESYSRSYSNIVALQCVRELENASDILCLENNTDPSSLDEIAHSTANEGWAWTGRLNLLSSHGSSSVISTRVALARLCGEPVLEGSLFLSIGNRARKNGLYSIAENFFSKAEAAFTSIPTNELAKSPTKIGDLLDVTRESVAKLKHESGESALALKILGHQSVQNAYDRMLTEFDNLDALKNIAVNHERERVRNLSGSILLAKDDEKTLTDRFARRLLRLTQWTVDGGLKGGSEITRRYRIMHKLAPEWEKGHFHFGKYVDSILQSRVTALVGQSDQKDFQGVEEEVIRTSVIYRDPACQKYILMAIEHHTKALSLDSKHVYQALPRLLSLWFDFTSIIAKEQIISERYSASGCKQNLAKNKKQLNATMAGNLKVIPVAAFYTAMPQLISRVSHIDNDTAYVVQGFLRRVLVYFPHQAMWPLAWLKGSKNPERLQIGEEIFKEAQNFLGKSKNNKAKVKLLSEASKLFKFLKDLATFTPPNNQSSINVKPWKGGIDQSEFIPPVQAALSISPFSKHASPKDFFPRNIPRMRAFSSRVNVMASKAKPKRIKAFAVPGSFKHTKKTRDPPKGASMSNPLSCDIGEIHFLVKQEAKGDLRKDARVQDLNNVINRLMASSESGSSLRRRRRLHLRTFAVTCLSEDTGILEWVPKTESLRKLVEKSYNPQTSPYCPRRRGVRLANFGDATLRSNYDKCQSCYFKDGNLSRSTMLFQELCLKPYPPLLYWWFVQKFHDPHAWYEARRRFTLSAAAWSGVGHVIGLGDRHSENILVDTDNGDCVHVDFDCIFDKGLNLPKPEVVPFRLTANMLDAFGPTGAEGVYSSGLQTAMRTLRNNRDTLLSVLEPFLNDPVIDWKRYRSQQKSSTSATQAKRSIKVIDERLQGIYNLRNPNLKKYRRTDGLAADRDDELTHLVPLTVEGQVNKMIAEATSSENLIQLYVGWMPWV